MTGTPGTDEPLDPATRLVRRTADPSRPATPGGKPEEPVDAATRIVSRASEAPVAAASDPDEALDAATRLRPRAADRDGGGTAPEDPYEPVDPATRIVSRTIPPTGPETHVWRDLGDADAAGRPTDPDAPATRGERRRAAAALEETESEPEARIAARRPQVSADAYRRATPFVPRGRDVIIPAAVRADPRTAKPIALPGERTCLGPAAETAVPADSMEVAPAAAPAQDRRAADATATRFDESDVADWPTRLAPRVEPPPRRPAPGFPRVKMFEAPEPAPPKVIQDVPARLRVMQWERDPEVRVVDVEAERRAARAARRRQAMLVFGALLAVLTGSAAGLVALITAGG